MNSFGAFLAYLAVWCLAFAMTRHQHRILEARPPAYLARLLPPLGWFLVLLSLLPPLLAQATGAALLQWLALLSAASLLLSLLLAYAPRLSLLPALLLLLASSV